MTTTATPSAAAAVSVDRRTRVARIAVLATAVALWFLPVPDGLTPPAWRLFVVFAAAILSVVVNAFPILTASVLAVAAAVLTGLLPPAKAYAASRTAPSC